MSVDPMKRAGKLDAMRSKHISDKLTPEEASNIVHIWGIFLEHSGGLRYLLGTSVPKSLLPYPIAILQGALNKMEAYYWERGEKDRVKLLEETEAMLIQFTSDKEALKDIVDKLCNKKWMKILVPGLKSHQIDQANNGYLIDGKLWRLSKS